MKLFVMIVWLAGGPTTIQGFESRDSCERAIPLLHEAYYPDGKNPLLFSARCVELPR